RIRPRARTPSPPPPLPCPRAPRPACPCFASFLFPSKRLRHDASEARRARWAPTISRACLDRNATNGKPRRAPGAPPAYTRAPMNPVAALFPDLALIAIGQLLFRSLVRERSVWAGLEKLIYYVLFPALLFDTILNMQLELSTALPAVVVALAAIAVGIALGNLARPLLHPDPARFAAGVQCAFRFNSYVLLALSQRIGGDPGLSLAAILMGVSVPVVNLAAVIPLARQSQSGLGTELARNPLILATLAGLLGHALGLRLPAPIEAT